MVSFTLITWFRREEITSSNNVVDDDLDRVNINQETIKNKTRRWQFLILTMTNRKRRSHKISNSSWKQQHKQEQMTKTRSLSLCEPTYAFVSVCKDMRMQDIFGYI